MFNWGFTILWASMSASQTIHHPLELEPLRGRTTTVTKDKPLLIGRVTRAVSPLGSLKTLEQIQSGGQDIQGKRKDKGSDIRVVEDVALF